MNEKTPSPAEILRRLQDPSTGPEDLHATQLKTEAYANGRKEKTVEIWERPPSQSRVELRSSEVIQPFEDEPSLEDVPTLRGASHRGGVVIRDGTEFTMYDEATNQYQTHTFERTEPTATSVLEPSLLGSSLESNFEIATAGTASIADRTAHCLVFRPKTDADSFYAGYDSVRLWVDDEYWMPLKRVAAYQFEAGIFRLTTVLEDVSFNTGFDDAIFQFDPPEGAESVG